MKLRSGCAGAPTTKDEIKVERARKCVSKSLTMHPMCDAGALIAQLWPRPLVIQLFVTFDLITIRKYEFSMTAKNQ